MKTVRTRSFIRSISVSVVLCLVALGGVAHAGHFTGACSTELNATEAAINDANFQGKRAEMNRTNLLAKLAASSVKISEEKFGDAVDKLLDISDKATALASMLKKSKLDDATGINTAVTDAIACVGGLL